MKSFPCSLLMVLVVFPQALRADPLLLGVNPSTAYNAVPGLTLTLSTTGTSYQMGEPIPVTMHYTYTGSQPLFIEVESYDRSGRIVDFDFDGRSNTGDPVRDPRGLWLGGFMGGLRSSQRLDAAHPYDQTAEINEWLVFDRPGVYQITASSILVHRDDGGIGLSGAPIPLKSKPLAITIVPPVDTDRATRLATDRAAMQSSDMQNRLAAVRDLRFMVDPRAIPLLVQALDDPEVNIVYEAWFGLRAFADLGPVRDALLKVVDNPAHPILPTKAWPYSDLLGYCEIADLQNKPSELLTEYRAAQAKWHKVIQDRLVGAIDAMPPVEGAQATVETLATNTLSARGATAAWKRVLKNAAAMTSSYQEYAGSLMGYWFTVQGMAPSTEMLKELAPDLKAVASDARISGGLRSSAIVALHQIGDDSSRDIVADDLESLHPALTASVDETIGVYRAAEIGKALLTMLQSDNLEVSMSASKRIVNSAPWVSPADITGVLQAANSHPWTESALLTALAIRAPDDTLPFIQAILNKPSNGLRIEAIHLLVRIDTPDALAMTASLFQARVYQDRETLVNQLSMEWQDAAEPRRYGPGSGLSPQGDRELPPTSRIPGYFFPDLLKLFQNDPALSVRGAARLALLSISGIPQNGWDASPAKSAIWVSQWEDWWQKNRARLGRARG